MTVSELVRASLRLLGKRDRALFGLAVLIQIAIVILDLSGVLLLGALGLLVVSIAQRAQPLPAVLTAVDALNLGGLSNASLISVVGGAAAALLLAKSVLSPLLMVRVFDFLARRETLVSSRLTRELFSRPLVFIHRRSSQETSAMLFQGSNAAIVTVLGQTVVACAEIALLTVLSIVLLLVNSTLALGAIAFFAAVGAGLHRLMGGRAAELSAERKSADLASLVSVQEGIGAYREITVAGRRALYVDRITALRGRAARAAAGSQLITMLPKYVAEAALILGAFSLAAVLFATNSMAVAAGAFAIFLATATRVMPSLLRLQMAALAIRSAASSASPVFDLAQDLGNPQDDHDDRDDGDDAAAISAFTSLRAIREGYRDFVPSVVVESVSFSYAGQQAHKAICGMNLNVAEGQSLALVGRSGAGKSTLADLILGVLEPDAGSVAVGGLAPSAAVHRWPGAIAYVPQDVMLTNGTVRANVALGLPPNIVDDDMVWGALRRAHLADYVHSLPERLDSQVGERGVRLSGGQRQRLGIARALFTRPRLIVLDEATSALDAETEQAIKVTLDELGGEVTMVIIAHRLSTVRDANLVVYLEEGKAVARGTFREVCSQVPSLQRQAALMGLGHP